MSNTDDDKKSGMDLEVINQGSHEVLASQKISIVLLIIKMNDFKFVNFKFALNILLFINAYHLTLRFGHTL